MLSDVTRIVDGFEQPQLLQFVDSETLRSDTYLTTKTVWVSGIFNAAGI